ncbi:hypothetical protein CMI38_02110 [Candidatus Pacearchaeota archaeon]|jgi:hypothetical protein|nr:hypothetical protein [Candidatus Pacearchaeota archaeon]|tara:strand:- start:510 stop:806 length:297 start_codon:yes stop_codon:yes gene_type:complete
MFRDLYVKATVQLDQLIYSSKCFFGYNPNGTVLVRDNLDDLDGSLGFPEYGGIVSDAILFLESISKSRCFDLDDGRCVERSSSCIEKDKSCIESRFEE